MSNLFLTLMIAFIVIVIAIACLAIGWLITGKTKVERGASEKDPNEGASSPPLSSADPSSLQIDQKKDKDNDLS